MKGKLVKKYKLFIIKKHFYNGYTHDDVVETFLVDEEPSKSMVLGCILKAKGDYAEIKEIYLFGKEDSKDMSSVVQDFADIDMSNVLMYRLKNPYYKDADAYEGCIKDPKKAGWFSLVAVVKTAVRNGLDISLWSIDEELTEWANDYLEGYRS